MDGFSAFDVPSLMLLADVQRTGSITAAARSWAMTTSAASQRINRLERQCDQQLLTRHARGVSLTEAGLALCEHASRIEYELQAAHGTLTSLRTLEAGRIRLGSFPTASASLVSDVLREFHRRRAAVELHVHSALRDELVAMLTTGLLELSVLWSYRDGADLPDQLAWQTLGVDPTVLLVPATFSARPSALGELADQAWLTRTAEHPATAVLQQACRAEGFEPRVIYRAHDYAEMQAMVAAGIGIALVPRLALHQHRRDVTMLPLAPTPEIPVRSLMLATHRHRSDTPAVTALREVFGARAARLLDAADPDTADADDSCSTIATPALRVPDTA